MKLNFMYEYSNLLKTLSAIGDSTSLQLRYILARIKKYMKNIFRVENYFGMANRLILKIFNLDLKLYNVKVVLT